MRAPMGVFARGAFMVEQRTLFFGVLGSLVMVASSFGDPARDPLASPLSSSSNSHVSEGISPDASQASPHSHPSPVSLRYRDAAEASRRAALDKARARGWPIKGSFPKGGSFELIGLAPDGAPLYNATTTTNATISINANAVQAPPHNLSGDGVALGIWDEGAARPTHQEFNDTGTTRTICVDGSAVAAHSTSVTGMAIAGGVNPLTIGSARRAVAHNFNWNYVEAELLEYGASAPDDGGLQISNHSYGYLHGWTYASFAGPVGWYWTGRGFKTDGTGLREDFNFGRYSPDAAQLDEVARATPYSLQVRAAGNDRADAYSGPTDGTGTFYFYDETLGNWRATAYLPATAPLNDNHLGGYDTIITRMCAKNVLTVGAVRDAVSLGLRDPSLALMTTFSGWGPTDDGRIKPDVVANGNTVRTVSYTGDDRYGSGSGTSFAAGSASGAAALLLDAAARAIPGWRMRASTLKALLIHGATDIGASGPDYANGYGLIDVLSSVTRIADQATTATIGAWPIVEDRLDDDFSFATYTVFWDGGSDLAATLCWTDPAGSPVGDLLNVTTPTLVNDLDLRLIGPDGAHYPFRLDRANPAAAATTGDNAVDNVEQVRVKPGSGATTGTFQIAVTHKRPLLGDSTGGGGGAGGQAAQWYSLIVSGQTAPAPPAPPSVLAADPAAGSTGESVAVVVWGGPFSVGTRFLLRRPGHPDIPAGAISASPERLFGDLDLAAAAPGPWDVVAIRPDGAEAVLPGGFTVTAPSRLSDWSQMNR